MEIRNINSNLNVNTPFKGANSDVQKIETKTAEADSMDALSSMGRAQVNLSKTNELLSPKDRQRELVLRNIDDKAVQFASRNLNDKQFREFCRLLDIKVDANSALELINKIKDYKEEDFERIKKLKEGGRFSDENFANIALRPEECANAEIIHPYEMDELARIILIRKKEDAEGVKVFIEAHPDDEQRHCAKAYLEDDKEKALECYRRGISYKNYGSLCELFGYDNVATIAKKGDGIGDVSYSMAKSVSKERFDKIAKAIDEMPADSEIKTSEFFETAWRYEDEEEFQEALNLLKKGVGCERLKYYVRSYGSSVESFRRLSDYLDENLPNNMAFHSSDEVIETFKKYKQEGYDDEISYELAHIDEKDKERFLGYINSGLTPRLASDALRFKEEEIKKLMPYLKLGLSITDAREAVELNLEADSETIKRASRLKEHFASPVQIALDEEESALSEFFIEDKVNYSFHREYTENPRAFKHFAELHKEGNPEAKTLTNFLFSRLEDEQIEIAKSCFRKGLDSRNALNLAESNIGLDKLDFAIDLIKAGIQTPIAIECANQGDDKREKIANYLKMGIPRDDAYCLYDADNLPDNFEEFYADVVQMKSPMPVGAYIDYEQRGFLEEKSFNNLKYFIKAGVGDTSAMMLAQFDYTDEAHIIRCADLKKRGFDIMDSYNLSKTQDEYKATINKYKESIPSRITSDIFDLSVEKVFGLKKKLNTDFETASKLQKIIDSGDWRCEGYLIPAYLETKSVEEAEKIAKAKVRDDIIDSYVYRGLNKDDATVLADSYVKNYMIDTIIEFVANRGLSINYAIALANKNDTAINEYQTLIQKGLEPRVAELSVYAEKNSKNDINLIKKLTSENFISDINKKVQNPNLAQAVEDVFDLSKMAPETAKRFVELGFSYEEYVELASKFAKSSLKLAMKKPNLYLSDIPLEYTTKVDGKYPTLEGETLKKYQDEFNEFARENSSCILKASKYLDSDTFNQLMDKRTEHFREALRKINETEDENLEIYSNLIKLKTPEDKVLTAKEKIQLFNIIYYFQKSHLEMDEFKDLTTIDVKKLKEALIKKALISLGFNKDEIDNLPEDKLEFDEEYVYTLFNSGAGQSFETFNEWLIKPAKESEHTREALINQYKSNLEDEQAILHNGMTIEGCRLMVELFEKLNELSEKEIFNYFTKIFASTAKAGNSVQETVRASIEGDFFEYITDSTNPIGKTNKETENIFKKNGINYADWLNAKSAKAPQPINIKGREFSLGFWNRNPQKDLFMGNRTSCCTALAESNGRSTPVYLMNSAINVLHLTDNQGNINAMSRIYMAKIDGKNTLVLDNIEVNSAFLKGLNEDEKIKLRNDFFKYLKEYAKQITGKDDVQIYFSTSYTKLPCDDLEKINKQADFIGALSSDSFYCNTAEGWISPDELKNEEREFYKVP